MFTGIIEGKGRVAKTSGKKSRRLVVTKPASWKLKIGGSVAVDGVCLTVVASTRTTFSCDVVYETLTRSTLGAFERGRVVNLERPLKLGDELGGHLVLGHVDGRGNIQALRTRGRSQELTIAVPSALSRYIVEKGSVAVNGVSLTVARKERNTFTVALIPHTLKITNLASLTRGDSVNIEVDNLRRSLAALRKK